MTWHRASFSLPLKEYYPKVELSDIDFIQYSETNQNMGRLVFRCEMMQEWLT